MSSVRLRNFVFIAIWAMLASCGFSPALQQGETASVLLEGIDVAVAGDRQGFHLEELLAHRLNSDRESSIYKLTVRLDITERDEATPGSGGIDRKWLRSLAHYELRSAQSDEIIVSGQVEGSASYSVSQGMVASRGAQRDAEERMLTQVADRLHTRLVLTADEWAR